MACHITSIADAAILIRFRPVLANRRCDNENRTQIIISSDARSMTRLLLCWEAPRLGRSTVITRVQPPSLGGGLGISRIPVANHGITYPSLQSDVRFDRFCFSCQMFRPVSKIHNRSFRPWGHAATCLSSSAPINYRGLMCWRSQWPIHIGIHSEPKYRQKKPTMKVVARDKDWGVAERISPPI
jgi:hypothetical protein